MTDKEINMPDGHERQVVCFFLHQQMAVISEEELHWTDDKAALFRVYSEFKVMLCCSSQLYSCAFWVTTSGFGIEMKVYHVEPSVTDVELGSQTVQKARRGISQPFSVLHLP